MGEQDQRCYLPDNHPIGINGGFVWHDTTVGEVEDTRDTLKLQTKCVLSVHIGLY